MKLSFEFHEDDECSEIQHENAELGKAYAMLDMLDGDKYSHLSIERGDNRLMCINGGAELFVVIDNCEAGGARPLINAAGRHEDITEVKIFGESQDVPEIIVVGKPEARAAVQCFYEAAEGQLNWYEYET